MQEPRRQDREPVAHADSAGEVRLFLREWLRAEREHNLGRMLCMVTDDVVFLRPRAAVLEGRQAVEDLYRTMWSHYSLQHVAATREVRVEGDWAWAWTSEEIALTPVRGGDVVHMTGQAMCILRRGDDGRWRYARAISNALPDVSPVEAGLVRRWSDRQRAPRTTS